MNWRKFFPVSLVALIATRQIEEAIKAEEPPHPHEVSQQVEEQVVRYEAGLDETTDEPSIVVGGTTASGIQTVSQNTPLISTVNSSEGFNGPNFQVTFREGSPSSFRPRKSGFVSGLRGVFKDPVAGTRILIQFDNISLGATFFVPTKILLRNLQRVPTGHMLLVKAHDSGDSAIRFTQVPATGQSAGTPVAPISGTTIPRQGYAIYEVYEALRSQVDSLQSAVVPVSLAYISNTGSGLPSLGQSTVSMRLAPGGVPDPTSHFGDSSTPRNAFSINSVTSSLLFPFVTNREGFDTRIVIANTSLDPFGTSTQAGKVTLFYYGDTPSESKGPQSSTTTGSGPESGIVPAGGQLVFTLRQGGGVSGYPGMPTSTTTIPGMPGFQGYIIAVCQFQYCHGFAFINKAGADSQAYLAVNLQRGGAPSEAWDSRTLS